MATQPEKRTEFAHTVFLWNFPKKSLLNSDHKFFGVELQHKCLLGLSHGFAAISTLLELHHWSHMLHKFYWNTYGNVRFLSIYDLVFVKYVFETTHIICVRAVDRTYVYNC